MPEQNPRNPEVQRHAPVVNLPPVVWCVLWLLLGTHLIVSSGGWPVKAWIDYNFAFIPARFGPGPFPQVAGAKWWSFLSYGLFHADWAHVLTNCLWLAIFSKPVAERLGAARYLLLFAASVIAGALAGLIVHWGQIVVMVGASAGVSGILAASIPLMRGGARLGAAQAKALRPFEILKDPTALTFTAMWLALTLVTATSQYATGQAFLEQRVIAWEAHLGGFIAGFVGFYLLDRGKR